MKINEILVCFVCTDLLINARKGNIARNLINTRFNKHFIFRFCVTKILPSSTFFLIQWKSIFFFFRDQSEKKNSKIEENSKDKCFDLSISEFIPKFNGIKRYTIPLVARIERYFAIFLHDLTNRPKNKSFYFALNSMHLNAKLGPFR